MQRKNSSYESLFENWEIEIARYWAKRFKNTKDDDEEDLFQECLIKWLNSKDSDKKKLASSKTYMSHTLYNFLVNLTDKKKAKKRQTTYKSRSIDAPTKSDSVHTLHDILGKKDKILDKRILHLDYQQVLEKLSPDHQAICEQIINHDLDMDCICMKLNKHPATVYRYINHIRQVFEKEGLNEY